MIEDEVKKRKKLRIRVEHFEPEMLYITGKSRIQRRKTANAVPSRPPVDHQPPLPPLVASAPTPPPLSALGRAQLHEDRALGAAGSDVLNNVRAERDKFAAEIARLQGVNAQQLAHIESLRAEGSVAAEDPSEDPSETDLLSEADWHEK